MAREDDWANKGDAAIVGKVGRITSERGLLWYSWWLSTFSL